MFTLPDLGYECDALEPFIDEVTMRLHHDKHHAAYVEKLNAALEGQKDLSEKKIEEILSDIEKVPEEIRQAVINHGGGHFNHTFWWTILSKSGAKEPVGRVKEEIEKVWGSFEKFKEEFTKSATSLFGSGWTWLGGDENMTNFHIHNHANQENPLLHKHVPVLGLDVWEHAFYLLYKNEKGKYVENWWNVINWDKVEEGYNHSLANFGQK